MVNNMKALNPDMEESKIRGAFGKIAAESGDGEAYILAFSSATTNEFKFTT